MLLHSEEGVGVRLCSACFYYSLNLGVVEDLLENCTAADDLDLQMVVF